MFSIEADKSEVSNDRTWAREDVQDSMSWDGPFPLRLPPPTSESWFQILKYLPRVVLLRKNIQIETSGI